MTMKKIVVQHARINKERYVRPTRIVSTPTPDDPTLVFQRTKPSALWIVPPITTPLYWFDSVMLNKRLITRVTDRIFVCDGHRFHIIAQDYDTTTNFGYIRWLVYREDSSLPNKGAP